MNINIPNYFLNVKYNSKSYPGNASGFEFGANCQHYCYEILRYLNYEIGNLRSSDLWDDFEYTEKVSFMRPLDLILINSKKESYGAHIGICIESDQVLHLSKDNGLPVIQGRSEIMLNKKYKFLIGIKRPIKKVQFENEGF